MSIGAPVIVIVPFFSSVLAYAFQMPLEAIAAFSGVTLIGASVLDKLLENDDSQGESSNQSSSNSNLDSGSSEMDFDDSGDSSGMDFDDGGMGGDMGFGDGDGDGGMSGNMDFGDDDGGMSDFGGGSGSAGTDELEHELNELQTEVGDLSSTVSTVRSENTEISNRIEEVEEDVRNLLDIYEMVTRGINPFVDETDADFDAVGGGGGGLGLFSDDDGSTDAGGTTDEPDDDLMNEDADGFFDDDFDEDTGDVDEIAIDEVDTNEDDDMMNDNTGGDKTFSELKEEYDSGDADWDNDGDNEEDTIEDVDFPENDDFDETDELDESLDDSAGSGSDNTEEDTEANDESAFEDSFVEEDTETTDTEVPEAHENKTTGTDEDGFEYVSDDDIQTSPQKPYVGSLPSDYTVDLLVIDWLEFLVEESNVTDTARAINYYERIEWISPEVAETLHDFLTGFGTPDQNEVEKPGTSELTQQHHVRSLKFIIQLTDNGSKVRLINRWSSLTNHD